jgi:hypothetical protein
MWWSALALGQTVVLDGVVESGGPPFVYLPFDVPAGVGELRVTHTSETDAVLDWGLRGPDGDSRGWGGGNPESVWLTADAASRGYLPGVPAGRWSLVIGKARPIDGPMPYRASVELLADAESTGPQRRAYVPVEPLVVEERWYAGDFHVHSWQSGDADAQLDDIAALARERGLDFVVLSDHNTTSTVGFLADAQARHPDVLFVPGMEFTTYGGHMNAIGSTIPLPFTEQGEGVAPAIEAVRREGGVVSINHPALDLGTLCIGCAWTFPLEPGDVDAVEIQTGGLAPVGALFTDASLAFWEGLTSPTALPAALGGSDDHNAGIGLSFTESPIGSPTTMVHAEALSVEALMEGIRAGRTVVKLQGPDDPMLDLSADGVVEARVTGDVDGIRFVVDGAVQPDIVPVDGIARLAIEPAGQIVRAEAWRDGERRTVTSHVVFEAPAGCGCTTGGTWRWPALRRRGQ